MIITLSAKEALDLPTFPSLLLFVTLFRLSLNVASTRLILLQGDAGKIIQTFGGFVAGGSFVVGLVIFLILVVIQFIVITKGAERISEVSARFTLDAMPGKQMAIDADLNAGIITEVQANQRRAKIVKESEFYGAMDGASKFIRGDAKAGLIITAVNIVGGIAMGYSRGMTVATAIKTYSILSIGDGLVSQIPSVIISISSGFLVTKISSQHSVGQDLSRQLLKTGQPLMIASTIIASMVFVPGLPKIPFLLLATGTALIGRMAAQSEKGRAKKLETPSPQAKADKEPVEQLLDISGAHILKGIDARGERLALDRPVDGLYHFAHLLEGPARSDRNNGVLPAVGNKAHMVSPAGTPAPRIIPVTSVGSAVELVELLYYVIDVRILERKGLHGAFLSFLSVELLGEAFECSEVGLRR